MKEVMGQESQGSEPTGETGQGRKLATPSEGDPTLGDLGFMGSIFWQG